MAAPAQAQEIQQQVPDVPTEELETFAEAYLEIGEVRVQLEQDLQQAGDADEANALQQEANQEMQAILREHDMTVQRYGQIGEILNQNQEQRAEFEEIVEELQEEEEGGG